jgi:hypothetical protein
MFQLPTMMSYGKLPPAGLAIWRKTVLEHVLMGDRAQVKAAVETALPALMLSLMAGKCVEAGFEFRPDILGRLNVAAVAPLSSLSDYSVSVAAKKLDEHSELLLRDLGVSDPEHGLYSCCMFVLKLVEEKFFADSSNMAVMVSLLLLNELRDSGSEGSFRLNKKHLDRDAGHVLRKAQLLGYFDIPMMHTTPEAPVRV